VICVDDHEVLVEGLRAQFEIDGHLEIVESLRSAEGLIGAVRRTSPHVVLLDIDLPGPDVFEVTDRLVHAHPGVRPVFLSAHVRDGYLASAYQCGAWGYFSKGDDLGEIIAGIKRVAASRSGTFELGRLVRERCGPTPDGHSPCPKTDASPRSTLHALTPRELEVVRLIGKGMSRSEIARELSRSVKTVDGHQDRVLKKLNLGSRAEIMRYAIREGLAEA